MSKPTEDAEAQFRRAEVILAHAVLRHPPGEAALLGSVAHIAEGLRHLSVGLRATYILLEQVKRDLALKK